MMDKDFLVHALTVFGIRPPFHVELLEKYYDRVMEVNKVMNLTSIVDEREFIIKHICDSVSPLLFMDINGLKCIDIGTGAGFPGIPLKVMVPDTEMDYMESIKKKARFVKETIEILGIDGTVYDKRAEESGHDPSLRESYDVVFSRAVSSLNVLLEYSVPLLKVGGRMVAYKGPSPEEEIDSAAGALNILSARVESVYKYNLPESGITHSLIVIRKIAETKGLYPRPSARISKKPL
jgi:16S rRNA methyltransferase GidB